MFRQFEFSANIEIQRNCKKMQNSVRFENPAKWDVCKKQTNSTNVDFNLDMDNVKKN